MPITVTNYNQRGIAIGPILFIVAILGVLAAAIAASSGSFSGSAQSEAARINAAALIQIGLNMKNGFSRMIGVGIDFDAVTINTSSTSSETDLFAPSGGSVNVPSVTLANNPAVDVWHFPLASVPQIGTSASDRLAVLKISPALCEQINLKANALSIAYSNSSLAADVGDVGAASLASAAAWPIPLLGKESGCVHNTNTTTAGYFYYIVLGIR
jgi:hypothetical protein